MAIDLVRRDAFTKAFRSYPKYIQIYVNESCSLHNPITDTDPAMSLTDYDKAMQLVMAQFAVRLITTRAAKSTPEMAKFAEETIQRYKDFQTELIGANFIAVNAKKQAAFSLIEANMAETIFSALAHEVLISINKTPEFAEVDFWRDLFLSFVSNQHVNGPKWHLPLQAVVLSHMQEFRRALEAEPVT